MIRTQINLTEEQYRRLQLEAKAKSRSVSALVRQALEKPQSKKKGNAWILLEMAKHAGRSGQKDLAQNYKRYLYGDKSKYAKK